MSATGFVSLALVGTSLLFIIPACIYTFMMAFDMMSMEKTGCCSCKCSSKSVQLCVFLTIGGGLIGGGGLVGVISAVLGSGATTIVGIGGIPIVLMVVTANMWIFFLMVQCGWGWKAPTAKVQPEAETA